jgi:methyl-accepting chemotaxis protein
MTLQERPFSASSISSPGRSRQKGIASIRYAMVLVLSSGLIVLIILNVLLQAVVLGLCKADQHAARLQQEEDYSLRLDLRRDDEVGVLANSFDNMVQTIRERTEELKRANEQLTLSLRDGLTGIANRRMFDTA